MHAGASILEEEEEEEVEDEDEEDGEEEEEEEEEGEEQGQEEEEISGSDNVADADADNLPVKGTPPPGRCSKSKHGAPAGGSGSGRSHLRDPPQPLPPKRARVLSPLAPGMVRLRPLIPASSGEGSIYEPGGDPDGGSGSSVDGSGGSGGDDPDGCLSEEEERLAVAGDVPQEQRWFRRQREREDRRRHRRCRHSARMPRSGGNFNHGDALDAVLDAMTDDGDRARFKRQKLVQQDAWLLELGGLLFEQARGAMRSSERGTERGKAPWQRKEVGGTGRLPSEQLLHRQKELQQHAAAPPAVRRREDRYAGFAAPTSQPEQLQQDELGRRQLRTRDGGAAASLAPATAAGSGAAATRSASPQLPPVRSASPPPAAAVLRDHRPFMHNGCNFLRMGLVPLGGSFLDLEGVVRHPAKGTGFAGNLGGGK